jgi:hypothetical protein
MNANMNNENYEKKLALQTQRTQIKNMKKKPIS